MSIKRKGSGLSFAGKRAMTGRLYILPWFIGFICFFLIPFIEGVVYTVNKLSFGENGVNLSFVGTANYKKLFSDLDFLKVLSSSLAGMFPRVLIIVFFSLFVALILRGEYKGRTLARAIFFLPVIISSGVVITVLQENIMGSGISGNETTYLFKATSFETLLEGIGLPYEKLYGNNKPAFRPFVEIGRADTFAFGGGKQHTAQLLRGGGYGRCHRMGKILENNLSHRLAHNTCYGYIYGNRFLYGLQQLGNETY